MAGRRQRSQSLSVHCETPIGLLNRRGREVYTLPFLGMASIAGTATSIEQVMQIRIREVVCARPTSRIKLNLTQGATFYTRCEDRYTAHVWGNPYA
jgi:hypothetical protein